MTLLTTSSTSAERVELREQDSGVKFPIAIESFLVFVSKCPFDVAGPHMSIRSSVHANEPTMDYATPLQNASMLSVIPLGFSQMEKFFFFTLILVHERLSIYIERPRIANGN